MRCATGCTCDCCQGMQVETPRPVWNAPGKAVLETRIGDRASFFETMRARLSSSEHEALAALTVRTTDDPAIALLDAAATMGDALTFYQERIANEGYLRTATERRSVWELGRLLGYRPRPGVAASAHLAYDIDPNAADPLTIETGSKVQSVPGPGELPQTFETIEPLDARREWNAIRARLERPASAMSVLNGSAEAPGARLWIKGIASRLAPGDPLLIEIEGTPALYRVAAVEPDAMADRTRIAFANWDGSRIPSKFDPDGEGDGDGTPLEIAGTTARSREIIARLDVKRSVPPRNAATLARDPDTLFAPGAEIGLAALDSAIPRIAGALASALGNAGATELPAIRVWALRRHAQLFGATAPQRVAAVNDSGQVSYSEWTDGDVIAAEQTEIVNLDTPSETLTQGSWLVLDYGGINPKTLGRLELPDTLDDNGLLITRAAAVRSKASRAAYGISGMTTRVRLMSPDGNRADWFTAKGSTTGLTTMAMMSQSSNGFQLIRGLELLCESEELTLATDLVTEPVCGGDQWIETDGFYPGLQTGRWLVVRGRRADVPGTQAVESAELVMIGGVRHDAPRVAAAPTENKMVAVPNSGTGYPPFTAENAPFAPGETLRTQLRLAAPLSYCYARDSVTINANVVKATHGDTRTEQLGSGDAAATAQRFTLRQPPLTFVAANEPDGIASTLHVYVDGAEWREAEAAVLMAPATRGFTTEIDNDSNVELRFGDGIHGARLPSGLNNVTAVYRSGIGKGGNVRAGQISQLVSRPLGVRGVTNPIEAAGGSDRDPIETMRANAPLTVSALDRLVSVGDYADFTRTFAGIAKAVSARFAFGGRQGVWLTISGNDDIEIPPESDLYGMLTAALRRYGDPDLPVRVLLRDRLTLVLAARIRISDDYRWDDVVSRVRAMLLAQFGYAAMGLGQSISLSAVTAAIQNERGVDYVDVDALGAVSPYDDDGSRRAPEEIAAAFAAVIADCRQNGPPHHAIASAMRVEGTAVRPAQIVCADPLLTDALILNRIEP